MTSTDNFVKPHAASEGQTPAERAGVGVEGRDKWRSMLRFALGSQKQETAR